MQAVQEPLALENSEKKVGSMATTETLAAATVQEPLSFVVVVIQEPHPSVVIVICLSIVIVRPRPSVLQGSLSCYTHEKETQRERSNE